ncbi:MAG: hypothetical protein ABF289_20200 [Clostridiales bacterium]
MDKSSLNVKKKIMYIIDEDYNYLAYNILLILNCLKCYSETKMFVSYMKLPYIINFISSEFSTNLFIRLFNNSSKNLNHIEYENLFKIYTKSKMTNNHIKRLIFSLKEKKIVDFKKDRFSSIGVFLNNNKNLSGILKNSIFYDEKNRINELKEAFPRIKSIKYNTFVKKVFIDNGVGKWED